MLAAFRLMLGPALLWQGRRVRKNILRLPEPPGPRQGTTGNGHPMSLLILGDSSAAGVGAPDQADALSGQLIPRLAERFEVAWTLHAQTGWTTQEALEALPKVDGQKFDAAIISLGVNDVTTETGLNRWLQIYGTLLERLSTDNGISKFVLSGLPPMGRFPALPQPLRWYLGKQATSHDRALGEMAAARQDAIHLPLNFGNMDESAVAEDGFHPGPIVYARWAVEMDKAIHDFIG
ncbi:MAG: SGNH/GDSL hydrolase family protein [Pseudomonadota bacterium]